MQRASFTPFHPLSIHGVPRFWINVKASDAKSLQCRPSRREAFTELGRIRKGDHGRPVEHSGSKTPLLIEGVVN